jgi:hypothetical protein
MMKESALSNSTKPGDSGRRFLWAFLLAGGCLLVTLLALLLRRQESGSTVVSTSSNSTAADATGHAGAQSFWEKRARRGEPGSEPKATAEQIVAGKVSQFARNRLEVLKAMARHFKVEVPDEVERFFEAAQAGRWEELQKLFESLKQSSKESSGLNLLWGPIHETFGVADQAHEWPAQKLLDYGHSILDSLRPGMIYVGGTDPGRFIPTLLNETSEGESHIIFTQNALADSSYLQYASFLYGDRMPTLTQGDSQSAFQEYISDAQKRLEHDEQFPNEPKQVRPGEDIHVDDGRVQVSGQVAVMAINEKLLQALMAKNPDVSFAMEQSFPFSSTYAGAAPLGPIMELRVQDEQKALTQESAAASLDYWRTTTQQLLSDPEAAGSSAVRQTWSKMADDQAALFLDHKLPAEAEQGFQLATELCPWSPEAVFRYVNLLLGQNRVEEAVQAAENGAQADPNSEQFKDLAERLRKMKKN